MLLLRLRHPSQGLSPVGDRCAPRARRKPALCRAGGLRRCIGCAVPTHLSSPHAPLRRPSVLGPLPRRRKEAVLAAGPPAGPRGKGQAARGWFWRSRCGALWEQLPRPAAAAPGQAQPAAPRTRGGDPAAAAAPTAAAAAAARCAAPAPARRLPLRNAPGHAGASRPSPADATAGSEAAILPTTYLPLEFCSSSAARRTRLLSTRLPPRRPLNVPCPSVSVSVSTGAS